MINDETIKIMSNLNKNIFKSMEEHCNYQIIVKELFRRIEEEFELSINKIEHWNEFKEKILKEK